MRMRARRHLEERMSSCASYLLSPKEEASSLATCFDPASPLFVEIGCGKGRFITQMALQHPDINFIAVERISNVLVLAMEKAKTLSLSNIRFVLGDAVSLGEYMEDSACDRIYLNFSDPWPKKGYAKRRLTHESFLALYERILRPGGEVHMKTDNSALFEYSLNSFSAFGYRLKNISLNLHASSFEGNIMTEFEERFASMGMPIYRLEAVSPKTAQKG